MAGCVKKKKKKRKESKKEKDEINHPGKGKARTDTKVIFSSLKYLITYLDLIENCVHVSKLLTCWDNN